MSTNSATRWEDLPPNTPIFNVTNRVGFGAPVDELRNRTPAAPPSPAPAAVPGVPPIPNQPGWSVDKLLCEHAIAGYHGEVAALMNRGLSPHEAHAYLRDHKPELMGAIQRYSEAAMANARQAEATPGERRGRQALKDFRAEVEALCNRGVKYPDAVRQVNETRGDLVEAMQNRRAA